MGCPPLRSWFNIRLFAFLFVCLYVFIFWSLLELLRYDPAVHKDSVVLSDSDSDFGHNKDKPKLVHNSLIPNHKNNIRRVENREQELEKPTTKVAIANTTRTAIRISGDVWRRKRMPEEFCGNYFANGFSIQHPICRGFTCEHNPTTEATNCVLQDIMINKERLKVSKGGEEISQVQYRTNKDELPKYSSGAFQLVEDKKCNVVGGTFDPIQFKYAGAFVKSVTGAGKKHECSTVVKETTLFLTRYEYANLYHTYTDLYNMFLAMKMYADEYVPVRVVFIDGHSKSHMDHLWTTVFQTVPTYISDIPDQTCFNKAVLVAPGYTSPLSIFMMEKKALKLDPCGLPPGNQFIRSFVEELKRSFRIKPRSGKPTILLVSRRDYIAHPRATLKSGTSRKFANEQELLKELSIAFEWKGYQVKLAIFETMSMQEQIQAVSNSSILIGMHGAGLSHVLLKTIDGFETGNRGLVEIVPSANSMNKHFEFFASMADALPYRRIHCGGANTNKEHYVDPKALVSAKPLV